MTKLTIGSALLAAGTSVAAGAMILRHDVPDSSYRAMAEAYRKTVVDIRVPSRDGNKLNHGNGVGTLVASDWVLTAAHIASRVMPGHERSRVQVPHTVYVDGHPYVVERIVLHPRYSEEERPWIDIALMKLKTPVKGAKPACLYPRNDELGQTATLVGNGKIGTGLTGPVEKQDGAFRATTVRIQGTEAEGTVLAWTFRRPGEPEITAMEGISGPGDSGGPAFLKHRGQLCIAGISASQDDGGLGEGRYGVRELYPRVSHYRGWVRQVMREKPAGQRG